MTPQLVGVKLEKFVEGDVHVALQELESGSCPPSLFSPVSTAMASSPRSQYLLRWNDHLNNYGDILFSLREEEEYVDCSIACEDGLVGAHRVVLAGCSSYLRDLFSRISNPHPVIFLLNTPRSIVLMLMEFIYRGQVHIPQHRLEQFVVLGQALKVKGLSQVLVPVSSTSSSSNETSSSITPLAFPHGLPLTSTTTLPFTAGPSSMNTSVLSWTSGQEATREEEEEEDKETEVDEENNIELEKRKSDKDRAVLPRIPNTTGRPRGRPRKIGSHEMRPTRARVVPYKKPVHSALRTYLNSIRNKVQIGAYAVSHGIEDAKRYILENYNVNARQKTLEHLIVWYQDYQQARKRNALLRIKRKKQQALKT